MFSFARKQGKREKALLESVELGRTVIPVPATIKPVSVSFFPFSLAGHRGRDVPGVLHTSSVH